MPSSIASNADPVAYADTDSNPDTDSNGDAHPHADGQPNAQTYRYTAATTPNATANSDSNATHYTSIWKNGNADEGARWRPASNGYASANAHRHSLAGAEYLALTGCAGPLTVPCCIQR